MKNIMILDSFEKEINKLNDQINKPTTDESLFWLNQAVGKFTKLRFNGDLVHGTGYEQTEKRRKDLSKLIKAEDYTNLEKIEDAVDYDMYNVVYPDDFMYALSEDVTISDMNGDHKMYTCVFECTQDSFMYRINNSLTDFHYRFHRARPLRVRTNNGCFLLTDKKYQINRYLLGYIKKPTEITLTNPHTEYTDFDDVTMYEIIKIAAQMYIENKADLRYLTITNEINTQE